MERMVSVGHIRDVETLTDSGRGNRRRRSDYRVEQAEFALDA